MRSQYVVVSGAKTIYTLSLCVIENQRQKFRRRRTFRASESIWMRKPLSVKAIWKRQQQIDVKYKIHSFPTRTGTAWCEYNVNLCVWHIQPLRKKLLNFGFVRRLFTGSYGSLCCGFYRLLWTTYRLLITLARAFFYFSGIKSHWSFCLINGKL